MKYLNFKIINLIMIMMLFFSIKGFSQNNQVNTNDIMSTIISSGSNATGSSGSVSYSIGQLFYTYIGPSVYNVAQGIQHQELNQTLGTIEIKSEPKTEILIFPNPTSDFVNINMKGFESESGLQSYQLYDLQGRLIKQNAINHADTQISLSHLSSSIYILQVYVNNKVLKTFKIVKK